MGQWLSERLDQPFVIDNRPGAGTNIAADAVVRVPVDGHTLLMIGAANAINATLYEKLNFNFIHDIAPVAGITRQTSFKEVHPSVPAKTVPAFIAYVRQLRVTSAVFAMSATSPVYLRLRKYHGRAANRRCGPIATAVPSHNAPA
jgi:tripartite-type tricarboxylate transporter receptor subunit TctC